MREREKSSSSRPCTISQLPPTERHGNEETRPSGTPYEPSDGSATDVQSPSAVPLTQVCTWSTAALAALAAPIVGVRDDAGYLATGVWLEGIKCGGSDNASIAHQYTELTDFSFQQFPGTF